MHASLALRSARIHTPLIHFIGKRVWPTRPEPPHPHPSAPAELKQRFDDFLKKFQSSSHQAHPQAPGGIQPSSTKSSGPVKASGVNVQGVQRFDEFWEAPEAFWRPRVRELDEWEIEAVTTGGASLR